MNKRLSRCFCALVCSVMYGRAVAHQADKPLAAKSHEAMQDCLRELWGKPVFWDVRAVAPVDPSVCKVPPEKVDEALKQQHISAFRLSNAVLLTSELSFRPESGAFRYEWKHPDINIRVVPRVTPGSRPPTGAELHEFASQILNWSHLPPITCPFKAADGQIGRLAFNVFIEIHKMHSGTAQESLIALLADSDAEHETVLGAGRLVYGELQGGHLQLRWESPLLETTMSQVGYVDLLGNGNLQIIVTSVFGMGNHTAFYAFDLDRRELSKQTSTCEAFSDLEAHGAVACPISTETDVEIKERVSGPKDLVATETSGEKVRYVFKEGSYQQYPPAGAAKPPSVPRATALNSQGMQFMQQKNYDAAIAKFEEAAQVNDKDPLFANNAGFAYYRLERYQDSLYWFDKAIEIDPNRAVAYLNLGDAYAKLNNNVEARRAYHRYLELAPSSKSVPEVEKKLEAVSAQ